MKPKYSDYLLIMMALSAIFLCGYGVGHLVGGKSAREQQPPSLTLPAPDSKNPKDWERRMFDRLDTLLELTPAQRQNVQLEVSRTSNEIRTSRDQAIQDYYQHLLTLHQRLPAHLTTDQQYKIEKIAQSLQKNLGLKFPENQQLAPTQ